MKIKQLAVAVAMAFTQYGCGGGGDNKTDQTALVTDAQGTYHSQDASVIVLDDGSLYAFRAMEPESRNVDHILMGRVKASAGELSSLNVMAYNLASSSFEEVAISASYSPKNELRFTSTSLGDGLNVNYNAEDSERTPTLAALFGNYKGETRGLDTPQSSTDISVTDTGTDKGEIDFSIGACKAKGTIAARASGNVYLTELNFGDSLPCEYANKTLSGIATLDKDETVLMMFVRASDTSHPLVFMGDKVLASEVGLEQ
jgi:hypothetical protein